MTIQLDETSGMAAFYAELQADETGVGVFFSLFWCLFLFNTRIRAEGNPSGIHDRRESVNGMGRASSRLSHSSCNCLVWSGPIHASHSIRGQQRISNSVLSAQAWYWFGSFQTMFLTRQGVVLSTKKECL